MRQYFKGYYFKCSIGDETIAFIPALHGNSASLQIITRTQTYFIPYPEIVFGKGGLKIKIGNSYFSEKGIYLDVDTKECQIYGKLKFGKVQRLKYNIMGPFRYLPFMQCKHSVVSMQHRIAGKITVNGKTYHTSDGVGYIEGDKGLSFPKAYLWTQCHFENGSVMLSVAEIPICGFCFKGIIGVVIIDGKEYRIATYLGARVSGIGRQSDRQHDRQYITAMQNVTVGKSVTVKQGKYTLCADLLEEHTKGLKAPVQGKMVRTIRESVSCKAHYCLKRDEEILMEFTNDHASFEYMYRESIGAEYEDTVE